MKGLRAGDMFVSSPGHGQMGQAKAVARVQVGCRLCKRLPE